MLPPYNSPVDFAICEFNDTRLHPRLSLDEIKALHNSGLSTDEDGETIADVTDEEIPHGFSEIGVEWFLFPNEII